MIPRKKLLLWRNWSTILLFSYGNSV